MLPKEFAEKAVIHHAEKNFIFDRLDITSFAGANEFLSNFYQHHVKFEGISYPTNEHAFAAAKTLNKDERKKISELSTPGEAKAAGRTVQRPDWESVKDSVMAQLVATKFASSLELTRRLKATNKVALIEGNHWGDKVWGAAWGHGSTRTLIGQNRLGQILMLWRSLQDTEVDIGINAPRKDKRSEEN